jgi:acyl-CoA synthetase (AMP-forming)/AMP-acid ligase II
MNAYIPFSSMRADSRAPDFPFSFGVGVTRTWGDFLAHVASIRKVVRESPNERWVLNCDDLFLFGCALAAILREGKEAMPCANTSPEFLAEILGPGTGLLCAEDLPGATRLEYLPASGDEPRGSRAPSLEPIDPEAARVTLYTSGSTGRPKAFPKRLAELEAESGELSLLWGGGLAGRRLYSTVNHQHIYGLLFSCLLPISSGIPFFSEQVRYPESLEGLPDADPVLVCSPAFLKRIAKTEFRREPLFAKPVIFSSGGVLPPDAARATEAKLGAAPLEIYGSTETGGIAWRISVTETTWMPFRRNRVFFTDEGRIAVASPYILDPAGFVSGDLGRFVEGGRFVLEGRADSIVKIEEKRISLTEVESRLAESPFVAESAVIALTGKRQYLGAVIALSDAGRARFAGTEKKELNAFFREHLSRYLEGAVIPKKWRFVDAIPRNAQDKVARADLEALFAKGEGIAISQAVVDGDSVTVRFVPEADSVYFDGHFPDFKLLPGVVQCDLAVRFCAEHLGSGLAVAGIPRMKFKKPIEPDTSVIFRGRFERERSRIAFSFSDAESGAVYSEGTISLGDR